MAFDLEELFVSVFAPQRGEVVTIMYDLPHGEIGDNDSWRQRRQMAEDWRARLTKLAERYGLTVNEPVTYEATGANNGDLPNDGRCGGRMVELEAVIRASQIVISMPEYSASAPLVGLAKRYAVRIASMPRVTRAMQQTALSADYNQVAEVCARLAPPFERAVGVEVTFSTGHRCYFDISDHKLVFQDNGLLHPPSDGQQLVFGNLPAGEVCTCPKESSDSRTSGEIPVALGGETIVLEVAAGRITAVQGDGPQAAKRRSLLAAEPALANIAEVAIGCNEHAVVTGCILEDEKAGFHWAYGRSDHLGGEVGVASFSAPEKAEHIDVVYAKGSPIGCGRLDFVCSDGSRVTAIIDGELQI